LRHFPKSLFHFLEIALAGKGALRDTRGNILRENFAASPGVGVPHSENELPSDLPQISAGLARRRSVSRFLRESRHSGAQAATAASV
jgi:hypothetical protein